MANPGGLVASLPYVAAQAENARRQKQQAQQHRGAAAAQFGGAAMVELCNRVQGASGRFHRQPIGPIGAVLSLTDVR